MKVDKNGLQVTVTARVVRRVLWAVDTADKTEAIHASSAVLLRLQEVDGRKVDNIRSFIYMTKRIAQLGLREGDIIAFKGYARARRNGYHFVRLQDIHVNRQPEVVEKQRVWGHLPDHVSLADYVDYVIPQLEKQER